ncbi:MAG: sigma-54 interaction domain-containing protein [Candidatus Binataceae bacterium]
MSPKEEIASSAATIGAPDQSGVEAVESYDAWLTLDRLAEGAERIGGMVVRSAQMRQMLKTIARLSPYKATVLVHGESGTGKELVARALHTLGPHATGPFVTFNCSNLVESLAESQLFGHVRGAFTDAREDALGYFRSANGGSLFLDEIGELPLKLQPKLLRAVETLEVQPVGSAKNYKVDIRLVAATNRDLRAMVKTGQFRDDLFYRLNAAVIYVPPLRERREAIPAFIAHYIGHYNRLFGKSIKLVSPRALDAFCAYQWPGNIRELANAVESAVLMTENDRIGTENLPPYLSEGAPGHGEPVEMAEGGGPERVELPPEEDEGGAAPSGAGGNAAYSLDAAINEASKTALVRALRAANGNCHRAAELLGVSRYTVYRMLNRYGMSEGRAYRTWRKSDAPGPA